MGLRSLLTVGLKVLPHYRRLALIHTCRYGAYNSKIMTTWVITSYIPLSLRLLLHLEYDAMFKFHHVGHAMHSYMLPLPLDELLIYYDRSYGMVIHQSRRRYLFWTDDYNNDIKRADISGSDVVTLVSTGVSCPCM